MNYRELTPMRAATLGIVAFAAAGVLGIALNADGVPSASDKVAMAPESAKADQTAQEEAQPEAATEEVLVDEDGSEIESSADEAEVGSDEGSSDEQGGDSDVAAPVDSGTAADSGGSDARATAADGGDQPRARPAKGQDG